MNPDKQINLVGKVAGFGEMETYSKCTWFCALYQVQRGCQSVVLLEADTIGLTNNLFKRM